jgi:hypothetical protein
MPHPIIDRDPLYTAHFQSLLASAGIEVVRLLARSPNLNAYAERFVRSIKQGRLRHIIPLGERHLHHVVHEFVEHNRRAQSSGPRQRHPVPSTISPAVGGPIWTRERLGGLLNLYQRKAAGPRSSNIGTGRPRGFRIERAASCC